MNNTKLSLNHLTIAAFLSEGLQDGPQFAKIEEHWDAGHFELVEQVVRYAPYADALATAAFGVTADYPGVFYYEVGARFGTWWGEQVLLTDEEGMAPDPAEAMHELRTRVYEFFLPAAKTAELMQRLREAIDAVPAELMPEA